MSEVQKVHIFDTYVKVLTYHISHISTVGKQIQFSQFKHLCSYLLVYTQQITKSQFSFNSKR